MKKLDGSTFTQMILLGAQHLENHAETIDALNVFPVPDGDTGTNMNLSMTSGAKEVEQMQSDHIKEVSQAFSKGLLMGARGNSGVILSQIFRGFSKGVGEKGVLTAKEFATALQEGVSTAYKAVMKPVEGTILTVAKDAANKATLVAETEENIITLMESIVKEAKASLNRTPDLLPVLKEVGVVDSGGQGLVTIYEGFLAFLKGEELPKAKITEVDMKEMINAEHHKLAQDFMNTDDIEYGYCTEFMVNLENGKHTYDEDTFRKELLTLGDSLVVISDDDIIRVHIHTERPGDALTLGQQYGSLMHIDIENMRKQHTEILSGQSQEAEKKDFALITVAMGSGIKELFESLGVSVVIEGGQTMNPSTKDITNAIERANAHHILILPNNKNIVMTAEQAAELVGDHVQVVPTTTIPQGITACLSFHPENTLTDNKQMMEEVIRDVKSGQITYAVRDTKINGMTIGEGHFMGLADGEIKSSHESRLEAAKQLLTAMISEDDEILTILYGEDVRKDEVEAIERFIEEHYDDLEVDIHHGKQPIYSYIFSVE